MTSEAHQPAVLSDEPKARSDVRPGLSEVLLVNTKFVAPLTNQRFSYVCGKMQALRILREMFTSGFCFCNKFTLCLKGTTLA